MITQFFGTEIIKKLVKSSNTAVSLPSGSVLKLGGVGSILNSTLSLDTSVIGVGGVETAILPNTLYYVYVVLDGVTEKLIASQSAIKPNFLQYRLVGGFYTNYLNNVSTVIGKGDDVVETYVECAGNGGEAITDGVTDIPFIPLFDSSNLWDGSKFNANMDTVINISGSILVTASFTAFWINFYLNGAFHRNGGHRNARSQNIFHFSGQFEVNSGDYLAARAASLSATLGNNANFHSLTIKASTPSPLAGLL